MTAPRDPAWVEEEARSGHRWTSSRGPGSRCTSCGQTYATWAGDPCPARDATAPPAVLDVYQRCADLYAGAGTITPGPALDYLRRSLAGDERFRRLVDEAVRITEERMGAELAAAQRGRDLAELNVDTLTDQLAAVERRLEQERMARQ